MQREPLEDWLHHPALVAAAYVMLAPAIGFRFTALCVALLIGGVRLARGRPIPLLWRRVALVTALWLTELPIDVSLASRPGPPRLIPARYGSPGRMREADRRGEVFWLGTGHTGTPLWPPRYVLVW